MWLDKHILVAFLDFTNDICEPLEVFLRSRQPYEVDLCIDWYREALDIYV